jgi:hypothetical protein
MHSADTGAGALYAGSVVVFSCLDRRTTLQTRATMTQGTTAVASISTRNSGKASEATPMKVLGAGVASP